MSASEAVQRSVSELTSSVVINLKSSRGKSSFNAYSYKISKNSHPHVSFLRIIFLYLGFITPYLPPQIPLSTERINVG